jgi:hypothetical protein
MWGRRAYLSLAGGIAAAAALAGAGCGSDSVPVTPVQGASGASGAQGIALSKPQFIDQADAICGEANAALAGLNDATVGNSADLQAAQELEIVRAELTSMQALTPPSEARSTLNQFLSALKDEVTALTAKKAALDQGGDVAAAETQVSSTRSSAQSAAANYGFKACSEGAAQAPSTSAGQTTTTLAAPPPTTPTPTTPAAPAPTPPAPGGAPTGGGTGTGAPAGGTGGGSSGGGGGGGGGTGGVSP